MHSLVDLMNLDLPLLIIEVHFFKVIDPRLEKCNVSRCYKVAFKVVVYAEECS